MRNERDEPMLREKTKYNNNAHDWHRNNSKSLSRDNINLKINSETLYFVWSIKIEFDILHYFPHFMCLHKYRIMFNRPNDKYKCIAKAHLEELFFSEKRWLDIGRSARVSLLEKFTWIIQLTETKWCIVFQGPHPSTDVIFSHRFWTLACAAQ